MGDEGMRPAANDTIPVVFEREGRAVTNSRDVAACFEKRHDHVLRDIDNLLKSLTPQNWGMAPMFLRVETPHPTVPGRTDLSFDMTRDGFALLAMGFTGARALRFKLRYIERFNAMEDALRRRAEPLHGLLLPAAGEAPLPVTRLWIELVREARLLAGPAAAREIWARSPLPPLPGLPTGEAGPGGVLATFLAECVEGAPGQRVAADRVYTVYCQWAARHEHDTVTRAAFGRALGTRLAKTKQGCIYYLNVRLRPPCPRPIA